MSERVQLFGLTFILPAGWLDITRELPNGSPPTLGKADGVGVIQFSVANYLSGTPPRIDLPALRGLLEEFGTKHALGVPSETRHGQGLRRNQFAAGDFVSAEERISAWYLTNGKDVVLVTYVTRDPNDRRVPEEFLDASAVVATLDFE